MYRLIACDLDETLLRKDKTVSMGNRKAIADFEAAGGIFVCATGRPFWTAEGTLKEIGQYRRSDSYVISFNGGAITRNEDDRLLFFAGISWDQANGLFTKGKQYNVCQHIYTLDTVWAYNMNPGEVDYLNGRQAFTEFDHDDLSFLKGQDIVKCLYENTDTDYLHRIAKELEPMTADMDVSYSSNRYLEFNKKGVNKGTGLQHLASILDIDIKDTIAIGDNYNDLSMIQDAGLGVGVANTVEEMKPLCDVITEHTCEEDGVAEVIYKYALHK